MSASFLSSKWTALFFAGGLLFSGAPGQAHESPVDHVEREFDLSVRDGQLVLTYRLRYADRALLMQIHQMDVNADGKLTDEEATAFFAAQATRLADLFTIQVEGKPLHFKPAGPMRPDARLGQTYEFSAPVGSLAAGRHPGLLIDGYSRMYPGSFRWRRPGDEGPAKTRVEPLTPSDSPRAVLHPEWLELHFEIIVPN